MRVLNIISNMKRNPLFVTILIFLLFCIFGLSAFYFLLWLKKDREFSYSPPNFNNSLPAPDGYLMYHEFCTILDFDPWHKSILKYINNGTAPVCSKLPPLSRVTGKRLSLVREHLHLYGIGTRCCYQAVTRPHSTVFSDKSDNSYDFSKCRALYNSVTLTPTEQQVKVMCYDSGGIQVYSNVHAVVSVTPQVLRKLKPRNKWNASVLIFGIDSVSRMHMIRVMPRTKKFLDDSGWVGLKIYNKIGENTLPNVMAILTGLDMGQIESKFWKSINDPLDDCPFIWKHLSHAGYVTAYAEDYVSISTFNYHKTGFHKQPTDYYLRPLFLSVDKSTSTYCLGPTEYVNHIYKYATDFAVKFRDYLHFGLFWINTMSHNDLLNRTCDLDTRNLEMFHHLQDSKVLNTTFVIFLSDHGFRFGGIRETFMGRYEDNLPFIYIWVPIWYREKFPSKYSNLLQNTNRLTSAFDLHFTLLDLLYGRYDREGFSCLSCRSLFEEIPANRTCLEAGIPEEWCSCTTYNLFPKQDPLVQDIVNVAINNINALLQNGTHLTTNNTECAMLNVSSVVSVWTATSEHGQYVVRFDTEPGRALFDVTASKTSTTVKIIGSVNRINRYGDQSKCMKDSFLKNYCFCLDK